MRIHPMVLWRVVVLAVLPIGLGGGTGLAAGGPQNVALAVNADSWASRTVANEYVRLRRISPVNVVSLRLGDLRNFESVDVETFRSRVLLPVLKTLEARGLAGQVDYVAYSSDIPYVVNPTGDLPKDGPRPRRSPLSAVTGLTYLYQLVLAKDARRYLQLGTNLYYRRPARPGVQGRPWSAEERRQLMAMQKLVQAKKWPDLEKLLREMLKARGESSLLRYNLACALARQGKADAAVAELARAFEAGYGNPAHAETDKDLEPLRTRDDFRKLIGKSRAAAKGRSVPAPPTAPFSNRTFWAPDGSVAAPGKGLRYLASTMLAVTSGRGNSVAEAVDCLRRAKAADATAPKGTIYLMRNGDIRSRTRLWAFDATVAALEKEGVHAEIVDGTLPKKRPDVMGLVAGSAGFNWLASGSTILPGAVCEHLTSFGGVMHQRGGQTCISEFIRYGAAGSSGTVTEPYAIQAKFPSPFLHLHYARGSNLAEAFYQSVAGPFQLLILGDPLCAPWAKAPKFTVTGLVSGQEVKGSVSCEVRPAPGQDVKVGRYEVYLDGKRFRVVQATGSSCRFDLNFAKAPEGYHELRIVAVSAGPMQAEGSWLAGFLVNNQGKQVAVSCPKKACRWGETISVQAGLAGAKRIEIRQDDRLLASADAASLTTKIDSRQLGMGPVRLFAVAVVEPDAGSAGRIAGTPIDVQVDPPALRKPLTISKAAKFTPGLRVTPKGAKGVVVKDLRDVYAVEKEAKVAKGQAYLVEGHFDVPADGVYQFQIFAPGKVDLRVDSQGAGGGSEARWQFVPVHLAKGTHRFALSAEPLGRPGLDLRFGLRGARTVAAPQFRCLAGE